MTSTLSNAYTKVHLVLALVLALILLQRVLSMTVTDSHSCVGKCDQGYKRDNPCQCNNLCKKYKNCCSDYSTVCQLQEKPEEQAATTNPLTSQSCVGKCGQLNKKNYPCQCNNACTKNGDCCSDYSTVCEQQQNAVTDTHSCVGKCDQGYKRDNPCQCNNLCKKYKNCCSDYSTVCQLQEKPEEQAAITNPLTSQSCVGKCGQLNKKNYPCQCNNACTKNGDCCSDYSTVCKQQQNAVTDTHSCVGKCDQGYKRDNPCQCNNLCKKYKNCCSEYSTVCQLQEKPEEQAAITNPLTSQSCVGKCGQLNKKNYPCQCNNACTKNGDCCSDYSTVCKQQQNAVTDSHSCVGKCDQGYKRDNPCQCNNLCKKYKNCCSDYSTVCQLQEKPEEQAATTNPLTSQSCVGKCGQLNKKNYPCQCNNACTKNGDCCSDYSTVCKQQQNGNCDTVTEVSRKMWNQDVNRLPDTAFEVDYQGHVPSGSHKDYAGNRLFTRLDESHLSKPTFQAYIKLLDNYDPVNYVSETSTSEKNNEVSHFLDEVLKTKVMGVLLDYFKCVEIAQNQKDLRGLLFKLWFENYPRSSKSQNLDTSGFEHVMVGEFKSTTKVNGFHGWLSFYLKEKAGDLNYHGYERKSNPHLVGADFNWEGRDKAMSSFIIGTSPEFDLALFTLCFLSKKPCTADLAGNSIKIVSYNTQGHVATAYMDV